MPLAISTAEPEPRIGLFVDPSAKRFETLLMVENVQTPIRIGITGRLAGAANNEDVMSAQPAGTNSKYRRVISIPSKM
jgi:purine-nucleoside phosphorylase